MIGNLEKPKLKIRSFKDIKERNNLQNSDKEFPCLNCRGTGRVYDTRDYDIIEGYKLASKVTCHCCGGTGNSTRKHYSFLLEEYRSLYKEQLEKFNFLKNVLKKLSNSFSEEEIKVLKYHFKYGEK